MPTTYAIPNGRTVMDATTYSGNGSSITVTNAAGFKPDLVWNKGRNYTINNVLVDSVRGASKAMFSDGTYAEINQTPYSITGFNSNGFSAADLSTGDYGVDGSGYTYVAWQWQAGQGTTSTNTDGSITSTVSVNASAGFSIATFTAQGSGNGTVGHGLGVAPSIIICKQRGSAGSWSSYFSELGNTKYINLNTTGAAQTDTTAWNSTSPTSSVFTLGSFWAGAGTMVAYCWAPVAGFSQFGSYVGNNSTDNAFVYTGFRPKFLLIKNSTSGGSSQYNWVIYDGARSPNNVTTNVLWPSSSAAENNTSLSPKNGAGGDGNIDFLSNGFKIRSSASAMGGPDTYIYAAFAENPFKYANAR